MTYKVTAGEETAIKLNQTDKVASVLQNIRMILATRQGTCPLYRGFGLPQNFLDKPVPVAQTMMCAEIKEAIGEYEPRAEIVNITFGQSVDTPGKIIPTVEVNIL